MMSHNQGPRLRLILLKLRLKVRRRKTKGLLWEGEETFIIDSYASGYDKRTDTDVTATVDNDQTTSDKSKQSIPLVHKDIISSNKIGCARRNI